MRTERRLCYPGGDTHSHFLRLSPGAVILCRLGVAIIPREVWGRDRKALPLHPLRGAKFWFYISMLADVNKRWNGCKRALPLGKIRMCRGTRSLASHTSETRATQVLSSKGSVAAGPFHDSLRYPLLLIFPPDRVEVPGNAGHIHREAQDFKKQVHRLHPNRRSERCPQADSAAGIILPHGPRWEASGSCLSRAVH